MNDAGFRHQALLYDGAEHYLAATVPYLREGLEAGEPILIAVDPVKTALIGAELGRDGEAMRFVDHEGLGRNPARVIPFWREFVERNGGRSVRGIGELASTARGPAPLEECGRHESLLNIAFAPEPSWSLLCPYDVGALPDEALERAVASHPLLADEGEVGENPFFEPEFDGFAGVLPVPLVDVETMRFGADDLREVRDRVEALAARVGLEARTGGDFVTAAGELAANSIRHGGGRGILRLWHENGCLLAEVEDAGRIEEPLVGRLRPGLSEEGGRGLWLANQLCDLVQIRSGEWGTVVRLHLAASEQALVC